MATGDDSGDLTAWEVGNLEAVEWKRQWRLSGWGVGTTRVTQWPDSGDDIADLADGEWRRNGSGEEDGELAAGDQR